MNLEEEKKADAILTKLAVESINKEAFRADTLNNPRI
jgi:ferritin-like metal-binding protein YciE